jgi:hypothetical protein
VLFLPALQSSNNLHVKPRTSVRERISPGLTASLFANYRSPVEALLELVDNFVSSGASTRSC